MGGEPKKYNVKTRHENLIYLYVREHYEIHKLLVQENENNSKLAYAFWIMSHNKNYEITSKEYEYSKKLYSKILKGRVHWYNNGTDEIFCLDEEVPEGYSKGRKPGSNTNRANKYKGSKWYHDTNGNRVLAVECPIGFVVGQGCRSEESKLNLSIAI